MLRRRRYDPSSEQVRVPDRLVGGGISDRGCGWTSSAFAATARSGSKGDGGVVLDQGTRPPQSTEKYITPVERRGIDSYNGDGVKRNLTAANSSGDFIVRVDGSTRRWSDIESKNVGGERLLGGSVKGAGRHGAEPSTSVSSGELVTLPTQRAESVVRPSGLDHGDTFEEHPGWEGRQLSFAEHSMSKGVSRSCKT